jgi:hypothetical protein
VVGSQTASLTPGPSFPHNLGCRCSNCQCEGIFDIYVSRPFQQHQEHPNARCFSPFCQARNIRESRRTPNPQLFQVLGFTPTLGQVRVATPVGGGWNQFHSLCCLEELQWWITDLVHHGLAFSKLQLQCLQVTVKPPRLSCLLGLG